MAMKKLQFFPDDLKDVLMEPRKQHFIIELNKVLKREFPLPDSHNQHHLGELGTRMRKLVYAVQKRLKFPETSFEIFFDIGVPTGSTTMRQPALEPDISDEDTNEIKNLLERKNELRRQASAINAMGFKIVTRVFVVSIAALVPAFLIASS